MPQNTGIIHRRNENQPMYQIWQSNCPPMGKTHRRLFHQAYFKNLDKDEITQNISHVIILVCGWYTQYN